MRIIELLENSNFADIGFVKQIGDEGKREIDYDLVEDLVFYMNNNDEAYRRHLHPSILKCVDRINANKSTKPHIFDKAVRECYDMYLAEYPIRELPESLDDKLCNELCNKLHEEVCQQITDGKYDERKGSTKR
jgi:hypothetical protein